MPKLEDIRSWWSQAVASGSLHHAYLIHGEGSKPDLVKSLISYLPPGSFTASVVSTDLLWLSGGGIDDIRSARHFLSFHPHHLPYRTLVIDRSDSLTPEAQNALLKIAESASRPILIFLLAERTYNLLPTIRSRFFSIFLPASSDTKAAYGSSPAVVLAQRFLSAPPAGRRSVIDDILAAKKDSDDLTNHEFTDFLRALGWLVGESGSARASQLYRRLAGAYEYNLNPRLLLSALAAELPLTS